MRLRHAVLAAALALGCPRPTLAARPVLALRSDLWCPYNCDPGSDHPGYVIEIVRAVFGQAGYDVDYQLLNWARSIEEVRLGQADAVIGGIPADVPGFVLPSQPIGESALGVATRRASGLHYTGPQSLDGLVLGLVADYAFAGPLGDYLRARRGDRSRVQAISGDGALARNLLKLDSSHVDVVIDDAQVLQREIAELQLGDRLSLARVSHGVGLYMAFSPACPDSPAHARLLSDGIVRLRASGRLAAILARYGLRDWSRHAGQ